MEGMFTFICVHVGMS